MKITQKKFAEIITSNSTVFLGIGKRLYTVDEFNAKFNDDFDPNLLNQRKATRKSNSIHFTGGSLLRLCGCEFYQLESKIGKVCCCMRKWVDEFDGFEYCKVMYYLIMGE